MIRNYHKIIAFIILVLFIFLVLEYQGVIWHNKIFASLYKVEGLDVSNHQGDIDWRKVASNNQYTFVYIKATEGDNYSDTYFLKNWEDAKKNGLLVGAYHFFSVNSSGKDQAQFFISKVPKEDSSLPPVVDVEIDLNQDPDKIHQELTDFLNETENYYQKRPILYVRYDTYEKYIKGYFTDYSLWVRDIIKFPTFDRNWLLWQYDSRGKVDGISTYVDIDVFSGTLNDVEVLQQY